MTDPLPLTLWFRSGPDDRRDFAWPEDVPEAHRRYLEALLRDRPERLIANVHERFAVARVGRHVVPLVINDGNSRACYATSPSGFYVDYASDFVAGLEGSLKRWALLALLGALGAICRRLRMDRVVYLNNWLLPTQPAWALTPENTRALIDTLVPRFPDHGFAIKGLSPAQAADLATCGYSPIFSRKVHHWDPRRPETVRRSNVQRDLRLLRRTEYRVRHLTEVSDELAQRLCELYRELYHEKYSDLSLRYEPSFFALIVESGLLDVLAIEMDGRCDGFATLLHDDERLVSSIGGYDSSVERSEGLYRLAHISVMKAAMVAEQVLNLSSGAGKFKKLRGAVERDEYEAAYVRHLGRWRGVPWFVVSGLYNSLGKKLYAALDV